MCIVFNAMISTFLAIYKKLNIKITQSIYIENMFQTRFEWKQA